MASRRSNAFRQLQALFVLLGVIAVLTAVMFWQGATTPKLALDLAGGTTVTLKAQTEKGKTPPAAQMAQAIEIMRDRVNGLGVSEAEVTRQGADVIVVQVPGEGQNRVVQLIGTTAQLQFRQVFAMGAGAPATVPGGSASPSPGTGSPPATPSAKATPAGKASPRAQGAHPRSATSPSAQATARSRALSRALAVPSPAPAAAKAATAATTAPAAATTPPATTPPAGTTPGIAAPSDQEDFSAVTDKAVVARYKALTCPGKNKRVPGADDAKAAWVVACDQDGSAKYILGPVRVQGQQIGDANPLPPDPSSGRGSWQVELTFKSQGGKQFGDVTTDADKAPAGSPQRQVAIVLDGQVVSAPSIDSGPILNGRATIYNSGNGFTQQYATDLSNMLRYGALPLKFEQSSIETVSPTLGSDQLHAGLLAGGIGMILVVLYSLFYYRGLGIVSILSLGVAGLLTYQSVCLLGHFIGFRLSLAGIAGLIVAIGITADSFVVYFERLRDEVRDGRGLRSATERGWERARRTILVADAVSFLAAAVLYVVSVGGVKGFAFTLGLTTLIDVVVVFMFTKPVVSYLASLSFFRKGHPLSGLDARRLGVKAVKVQSGSAAGSRRTKEA